MQGACLKTKHLAAHGKAVLCAGVDLQAAEQGQTESLTHLSRQLAVFVAQPVQPFRHTPQQCCSSNNYCSTCAVAVPLLT